MLILKNKRTGKVVCLDTELVGDVIVIGIIVVLSVVYHAELYQFGTALAKVWWGR